MEKKIFHKGSYEIVFFHIGCHMEKNFSPYEKKGVKTDENNKILFFSHTFQRQILPVIKNSHGGHMEEKNFLHKGSYENFFFIRGVIWRKKIFHKGSYENFFFHIEGSYGKNFFP